MADNIILTISFVLLAYCIIKLPGAIKRDIYKESNE